LQKHLSAGRDQSEGEEVKRWKVAISLALAAALVGPLVTGTWKLRVIRRPRRRNWRLAQTTQMGMATRFRRKTKIIQRNANRAWLPALRANRIGQLGRHLL